MQIRAQLAKLGKVTKFQPNRIAPSVEAPGAPCKDVLVTLFSKARCQKSAIGDVSDDRGEVGKSPKSSSLFLYTRGESYFEV